MNKACPVCNDTSWKKVLIYNKYRLLICNKCRLYSLYPKSQLKNIDYVINYDYSFYERHMHPFRKRQFSYDLPLLIGMTSGKKLLDVGCAAGWFLQEANKLGFKTTGLEPQLDLAKIAKKENPKSKIIIGDISFLTKVHDQYDVITMWNVLEHFHSPTEAISIARGKLQPGGVLAIRTPNSFGPLSILSILLYKITFGRVTLLLKGMFQLDMGSKHWFLFSKSNLLDILKKQGLIVLKIYSSPNLDWRGLSDWFKARRINQPKPILFSIQISLRVLEIIEKFLDLQDDLVVFAQKNYTSQRSAK